MKKLLLASAVSTAFALPNVVFAQAAPAAAPAAPAGPAVPTLDKIFEASGLTVSGYIDAAYSYANREVEKSGPLGFSDRVFDSQNNSFGLHQFGLTVAKQPKEGFGGLVNITAGKDAQVIHSFPEGNSGSSMYDLTQAYAQYASGALTVIGGKFTTLAGTEVIASNANTTFSRSILFGAVPFTHTGVRATYVASDMVSLTAGVNNGWDQLTDSNKGKTLELGTTITPIKPLSIVGSYYSGKESANGTTALGAPEGKRTSADLVVTYTVIDPLTLGIEVLKVTQENAMVGSTTGKAEYKGAAFYATWMIDPKWRLVGRYESFDDKNGFHFLTTGTTGAALGVKYKEATATLSYLATDNFELRGEVRRDTADNGVFVQSTGISSKDLMSYALQGVYKF